MCWISVQYEKKKILFEVVYNHGVKRRLKIIGSDMFRKVNV